MPDLMANGRLQSEAGQLYVVPRPSTGIPNAVQRNHSWLFAGAIDSFGYQFIEDAGSAVPSTATFCDGIAYTPDGAVYVTDAAPDSSARYRDGFAIRADGALHVDSGTATGGILKEGLRVADGRLFVTSDIYKNADLAAWYRQNVGQTVTGAGVSEWADQSGNDYHLLQGTDASRPALQADGSVLFNGTSSSLGPVSFTHNQPVTWYLLMKQITWTDQDRICSGDNDSFVIVQRTTTPRIRLNAGAALDNDGLVIDTYGVVCCVFNGASSVIQVNNTSPVSGDGGAQNADGFTLGSNSVPGLWSNIQVKEVILFGAAHNAATRARVIAYLTNVNGGSV